MKLGKTRGFLILILLVTALVLSGLGFSWLFNDSYEGTSLFGQYTYARSYEINGKEYNIYQSGEKDFSYFHDENGFILIVEDDGVYYAENDNGRPVNSKIEFGSDLKLKNLSLMTRYDIDFDANPNLLKDYSVEDSYKPAAFSLFESSKNTINNFVIYIAFSDDSSTTLNALNTLAEKSGLYLNGEEESLRDYFLTMSNNTIEVNSHFPTVDSVSYVYKDSNKRSYYNLKEGHSERGIRESRLLTAAVNAAKNKFEGLSGLDLDYNNDGYLDGVSFIVSGSSGADWGGLLWPHSWNLTAINDYYNNKADASIEGIKVGDFTFSFATDYSLGLLCHEFNHVLGAPDLYHKNYDFVPVGIWDLMQHNLDTPQYSLTFMRDKYIGGLGDNQIVDIKYNGVYSLKPVSLANQSDILSYKIPTARNDEYFMVEYRNPDVSASYDNSVSGAGLIIYRIKVKDGLSGNYDAVHKNASKPDEVYVFRPSVASGGSLYETSRINVENAYLSPYNNSFKKVGLPLGQSSGTYNYDTLYYTDGTNSGIVIEALSLSSTSIEFRISLSLENSIDNDYFLDKLSLENAKTVNSEYSGIEVNLNAVNGLDLSYLSGILISLTDISGKALATNNINIGRFISSYSVGQRSFSCPFVVSDKGGLVNSAFEIGSFDTSTKPHRVKLEIVDADGDRVTLEEKLGIDESEYSWQQIKDSILAITPSIEAGSLATVGIKYDGSLSVSGQLKNELSSLTNITAATIGLSHILTLDKYLTVSAKGSNQFGELNIDGLSNVVAISAGSYTSYALLNNGRVVGLGLNDMGQLETSGWNNIVSIAAGSRHVVGVKEDGTVVGAGNNSEGQISFSALTNVKAVSAGNNYTAVLLKDGTVKVFGQLNDKEAVASWKDITKIAAGGSFLYGLTSEGCVLAVGNNAQAQLEVSMLTDIKDLSAGEYHGAFLRIDGVVEYVGAKDSGVTEPLSNLILSNYIEAQSIKATIDKQSLLLNQTAYIETSIYPIDASYKRIIYTSSNPEIATVDSNGAVKALLAGSTVITVVHKGTNISEKITVTVIDQSVPTSIRFKDEVKNIILGEGFSSEILFSPVNAVYDVNKVSFSVDNDVVSIDKYGYVTPKKSGAASIKAIYSDNGVTLEAFCSVNVYSSALSIELVGSLQKTDYFYGEEFDPFGLSVKVNLDSQNSFTDEVSLSMIKGYDKHSVKAQSVYVRYMGKEVAVSQQVTVFDYYISVEIEEPPKVTEFLYGQSLDVSKGTLRLFKASGGSDVKAIPLSSVSGYSPYTLGMQMLVVDVDGGKQRLKTYFTVTVIDIINHLTLSGLRLSYSVFEPLDYNQSLIVVMLSGAEALIKLADCQIQGYNSNILGLKEVSISYFEQKTGLTHTVNGYFNILLGDYSLSIEGDASDGYFRFMKGQDLHSLRVTFANAFARLTLTDTSDLAWYQIEGFDKNAEGLQNVSLLIWLSQNDLPKCINSYSLTLKCIQSFDVTVVDNEFNYLYAKEIGIKLEVSYDDGQSVVFVPQKVDYDPELLEVEQDFVIYDMGYPILTRIIIWDYYVSLVHIEDKEILFGEDLTISVIAKTATGRLVDISEFASFSYDNKTLGSQTVTVSYNALPSLTFNLTVLDAVVDVIEIDTLKTDYLYGQTLDLTSKYKIVMLSGLEEIIDFNTIDFEFLTEFSPTAIGTTSLTLTHKASNTVFSYQLTLSDYCVSLSSANTNLNVYYGDNLELLITALMASGLKVELEKSQLSYSFNSFILGQQTITVKALGKELALTILVMDKVIDIILLKASSLLSFSYGMALAFNGSLRLEYLSGAFVTLEGSDALSLDITYDPVLIGKQKVKLSIDGISIEYEVEVLDVKPLEVLNDNVIVNLTKGYVVTKIILNESNLLSHIKVVDYLSLQLDDNKLLLINTSGSVIIKLDVYLFGDANLDGVFDKDDLAYLAKLFLEGGAPLESLDFDGDKAFTLTDIVNWARKAEKNKDDVNNLAKVFITNIKREEENEEDL